MSFYKNEKYLLIMNDGTSYAVCKFITMSDDETYTFKVIPPTSDERSQYNITERNGRVIYVDSYSLNSSIYVENLG